MKDNTPSTELSYNDLPEMVDIVGVSFRTAGKIYYFASGGVICHEGEHAVVETTRGAEYGIVTLANHPVPKKDLVLPLRSVIRVATPEDDQRFEQNAKREEEAYTIATQKIAEHKLDMKLVDVEYTFDNSKLLFYFTADDRVDFRELVKDLASVFRTRIELRQIGIRDEAKMMGGLGICGRVFCCHSFLGDFAQVTIKMAKEQNLSLNAAKISGACGKLMCCLRYEHESYQQEIALTPKVDSHVTTPDGPGTVVSTDPLRGICNVRLDKTTDNTTAPYHRDLLNRPENPATAPVVIADKAERPTKSETAPRGDRTDRTERTERAERNDRNERNDRHSRHNRASTEAAPEQIKADKTELIEKAESSTTVTADAAEQSQRNERGDRRGGRHGRGRHDSRKKSESKGEPKPTESKAAEPKGAADSKASGKPAEELHSAHSQKADKNERKDRPAHKQPRPQSGEKKPESKFDVKFGGGQLPAEPKGEENKSGSHSGGHGRHHHHRRGGKGEKKNEKKPQKTENNN